MKRISSAEEQEEEERIVSAFSFAFKVARRITREVEVSVGVMKRSRQHQLPGEEDEKSASSSPQFMLSFKAFLDRQSDTISEDAALARYSEYKDQFRRVKWKEFFDAHESEDWFRARYHPEVKLAKEQKLGKARLLRASLFWSNISLIERVQLFMEDKDRLVELMDKVVKGIDLAEDIEKNAQKETELTEKEILVLKRELPEEAMIELTGDLNQAPNYTAAAESECIPQFDGSADPGPGSGQSLGSHQPTLSSTCCSIHLRRVPASVSKAELEAVLRQYSGFRRLALCEPEPEQWRNRRGWATFAPGSRVKEVCLALGELRLAGQELQPVLNRELSQRVRAVSGPAGSGEAVRHHLSQAARLVQQFDNTWQLQGVLGGQSLCADLAQYLDEEASAEEEEELVGNVEVSEAEKKSKTELLLNTTAALDKLLLYLRIVHSFDFYQYLQYQNEDDMPNRLGIIHVRGAVLMDTESQSQELENYLKSCDVKMSKLLRQPEESEEPESNDKLLKLGGKLTETEIKKFIESNCKEIGVGKWQCPLSGKKFRGPEFVTKHIISRFSDKLDAIRAEVGFWNNFLLDPDKPQLSFTAPKSSQSASVRDGQQGKNKKQKSGVKDSLPWAQKMKRAALQVGDGLRQHGQGGRDVTKPDPRPIVDYSDLDFL